MFVCGKYGLRKTLPMNWVGKCAWVRDVQPTHILPLSRPERKDAMQNGQRKANASQQTEERGSQARSATQGENTVSRHTFQDVPMEFKVRSGMLASFIAAIPVIGTAIQAKRNAEWINYVYYNQMLDYTVD